MRDPHLSSTHEVLNQVPPLADHTVAQDPARTSPGRLFLVVAQAPEGLSCFLLTRLAPAPVLARSSVGAAG
jgi:hypothetical protein